MRWMVLDLFLKEFQGMLKAQGANWMVGRKPGETERGIESIDLEARWVPFFSDKVQGSC